MIAFLGIPHSHPAAYRVRYIRYPFVEDNHVIKISLMRKLDWGWRRWVGIEVLGVIENHAIRSLAYRALTPLPTIRYRSLAFNTPGLSHFLVLTHLSFL